MTGTRDRVPVWQRPYALGYQKTLRGLGGIVAPLLAGFSMAAIATIVSAERPPPLAEWAIAAFSAAIALLLFSMQVAILSLTQNCTPQDVLAWRPEVTVSEDELQIARSVQVSDFAEMKRMGRLSMRA